MTSILLRNKAMNASISISTENHPKQANSGGIASSRVNPWDYKK